MESNRFGLKLRSHMAGSRYPLHTLVNKNALSPEGNGGQNVGPRDPGRHRPRTPGPRRLHLRPPRPACVANTRIRTPSVFLITSPLTTPPSLWNCMLCGASMALRRKWAPLAGVLTALHVNLASRLLLRSVAECVVINRRLGGESDVRRPPTGKSISGSCRACGRGETCVRARRSCVCV